MEQLVLLILIGLIGLIQWIMQQAAEAREKRKLEQRAGQIEDLAPPPPTPVSRPVPTARQQPDSDESMRRLMEALGLPSEASPPVPKERPPVVVERAPEPPPLPPPVPRRPVVVEKVEAPAPAPYLQAPEAPVFVWEQKKAPAPAPTAPSRVRTLLGNPQSIRDAVVLTEILGRPKALS